MGGTIEIVIVLAIAVGGFIFVTKYLPSLIQNAQAQQPAATAPVGNCILDTATQTNLLAGTQTPCDPATGLAIASSGCPTSGPCVTLSNGNCVYKGNSGCPCKTCSGSSSKTTGGLNCPTSCACICSGGKPVCKGNSNCSCQGSCGGGGGSKPSTKSTPAPTIRHPLGGIVPGLGSVKPAPAPAPNPHPLGTIIPGLGLEAHITDPYNRISI
jgi:hypothetical protein